MEQINKIPTDLELSAVLDKWQVEMPDPQFFINLPAVIQQTALKPAKPWPHAGNILCYGCRPGVRNSNDQFPDIVRQQDLFDGGPLGFGELRLVKYR